MANAGKSPVLLLLANEHSKFVDAVLQTTSSPYACLLQDPLVILQGGPALPTVSHNTSYCSGHLALQVEGTLNNSRLLTNVLPMSADPMPYGIPDDQVEFNTPSAAAVAASNFPSIPPGPVSARQNGTSPTPASRHDQQKMCCP
jgi:hypothetical protein